MARQEKKIITSYSECIPNPCQRMCVLQVAIWRRWSPDMKATIPDRYKRADISLHIILTSLIDGAAPIFTPWGVNPGTCWMVVWFDLIQFGCDGKEVPSLPVN
jgi:hypothetical protein